MEVRQLEHFLAVAEEGQFTPAAARCNISQSALSASIKALEREVGTPLFVRTTRSVRLTDAGEAIEHESPGSRPIVLMGRQGISSEAALGTSA